MLVLMLYANAGKVSSIFMPSRQNEAPPYFPKVAFKFSETPL
jgi:hypothetical protein